MANNPVSPNHGHRWMLTFALAISWLVGACATPVTIKPNHIDSACAIFQQQQEWHSITKKTQGKWGVPVHVQLAIIRQESSFRQDARPPREHLLGFIPWFRPSSALGFGQAKTETWEWYRQKTGKTFADREEFADVSDFIGWYTDVSHRILGIAKSDAYGQYLAYHEGHEGYKRKSYLNKPWLVKVAEKVKRTAEQYRIQLAQCQD